ncbi:MAG: MogA/MoaB family molybdenum cofactor biosynthesis protein [Pirellulales bacterium]|nr:MogA/MoaB family molybdenum cofactor biosynthesis protein [Pirellulales bacterium]
MSVSPSTQQHREQAPQQLSCAVVTVSDSRTLESDTGGKAIVDLLESSGHKVLRREIIPDEPEKMRELIQQLATTAGNDAVLMTGGTGVTSRDQTYETVSALLTKHIPGYGELFRQLSYAEIGPATMLSRATGGLIGNCVLLTMPGSPAGVRLAMEKIILPELPHLVREARR